MAQKLDLSGSSVDCAKRILGWELVREIDGQTLRGKIVETEAYDQTDAASHSFRGMTPRTAVMFGPSGYAYVYFTYGMHYCMNVVTGNNNEGSAVLIRAIEPLQGMDTMRKNRRLPDGSIQLTNGPAKLCQAFRIDKGLNKHDLTKSPLLLVQKPTIDDGSITTTTRIGISQDSHRLRRFYITGNPYVSKL